MPKGDRRAEDEARSAVVARETSAADAPTASSDASPADNCPSFSALRPLYLRHRTADVRSLALQFAHLPERERTALLTQIAGWQMACRKLPSYAAVDEVLYPPHLPLEQCSSELTALHKASIVRRLSPGAMGSLIDLTGGFGVDCLFLSRGFAQTDYVEQSADLCRLARHNFAVLGAGRIRVHCADCLRHLSTLPTVDWILLDPARRDSLGGRTVGLRECQPDVTNLVPLMLRRAHHVMLKLSPMLSLTEPLGLLPGVQELDVVAVDGECKELICVLSAERAILMADDPASGADQVPILCTDIDPHSPFGNRQLPREQTFAFTRHQEAETPLVLADALGDYLYEPNAAILKAGAFRTIAQRYGLGKLHANTHLYTSASWVPDFPGRRFRVVSTYGWNKAGLKALHSRVSRANLTVRNFPAQAAELRKRLRLADGGDTYLFATTLADGSRQIVECRKA